MNRRISVMFRCLLLIALALSWATSQSLGQAPTGQPTRDQVYAEKFHKVPPSAVKAAAVKARMQGMKPGIAGAKHLTPIGPPTNAVVGDPGGMPHYYGPYGNWAFSPLPNGPIATVTVQAGGTGYTSPVVTVDDAYVTTFTPANVTATVTAGVITGLTIVSPGAGYEAPVVTITDPTGTGALADAVVGGVLAGGMRKFMDTLPQLGPGGINNLNQYLPVAVAEPCTYSGQAADCYSIAVVEFNEKMHTDLPPTRLRGYVQLSTAGVPGAAIPLFNPDGSPIMMPDGVTQARGVDNPHYLGPIIVAQGKVEGMTGPAAAPKPVRVKFYNLLPAGPAGDLFIPVDESLPGAGYGPAGPGVAGSKFTQNRATIHLHGNNTVWISDGNVHQWIAPANESTPYPAGASARNVPDMGTDCDADPVNAPGLPGSAVLLKSSGCMTYFFTNAQSARLQFYHDHAEGITRLNVYAGEAAGYVITDAVEQDMINGTNNSGVNPGLLKVLPDIGIPLVIQDKTWVDAETIYAQDPTWASGTGGIGTAVTGDLWYPHVYMIVTNPFDPSGVNPFGRWFYGPWFAPPVPVCVNGGPVGCIENGPVPNPYHQPDCDLVPPGPGCTAPWEAPVNPGEPNPSAPGESFLDTPTVNGTAYPVLNVEPKAYRFRILNASNDRAMNLQLYVAADKTTWVDAHTDPIYGFQLPGSPTTVCAAGANPANCTEVKMVPVIVKPANQYADTPSGIPDPTTAGPSWIQIGTEGGFTPAPVVIPQQPVGYNLNQGYFNFGIVNQHSLWVMAAMRSDVIVDFTAFAGKTLILYNDAPAPVPAYNSQWDFFTGMGNQMAIGSSPNTQPGYGPNIRTVMQIRVGTTVTTPTTDVTLANLQTVFAKTALKRGVFEISQDPIIVPQAAYNTAYNQTFPTGTSQYILNVADSQKSFQPLGYDPIAGAWNLQPAVTIPFELKGMHDEMGGVYDTQYGRMSGMLGISHLNALAANVVIPYPYLSPPTDIVKGSLQSTKIGDLADGTQIWRVFHLGVDTHPIHVHLFNAQVISRVGQDGQVAPGPFPTGQPVDAQDVGWKETVYINPLEIAYLALRPTVPTPSELPFELPNSVRLIDPTLPEGATLPPPGPAGWMDPNGNPIAEILNHYVNFGWEYVWHCHILSHEEMDFMHSLVFAVPPLAPTGLAGVWNGNTGAPAVALSWVDQSSTEAGFSVQRALDTNFTNGLVTVTTAIPAAAGKGTTVTYTDTTPSASSTYFYRVLANGQVVGDTTLAAFPTMSADSVSNTAGPINTFATATTPLAPSNLSAISQAGPQVTLTWRDNATNESGFIVNRCSFVTPATTCTVFAQIATVGPKTGTGTVTYIDTAVVPGTSYRYQVAAFNAVGTSAFVTVARPVVVQAIPPAPTSFIVSAVPAGTKDTAILVWTASTNPNSFTIQRATNLTFTTGLTSSKVSGASRSLNQTVNKATVYYYRISANNSTGGSSPWTNALPFPILTP